MSQGTFTEKLLGKVGQEIWPQSPDVHPDDVYMALVEMYGDRCGTNPHAASIYGKSAGLVLFASEHGDSEEAQTAANEALALLRGLLGSVRTCSYSATHKAHGVPSVTVIDCGPVGLVDACQACAQFYARQR